MSKKEKPAPEARTERFQMRATPSFLQEVEDWRAAQRPIPSLTEAICRLVDASLDNATWNDAIEAAAEAASGHPKIAAEIRKLKRGGSVPSGRGGRK